MASTTMTRKSKAPFVILAVISVAAIVGILVIRNGSGTTTPPAPAQAIASPAPVPTKQATITPKHHGPVTTWQIPEALVGLRSIAVGPDGRVWLTEQNRGQVDSLDGNELTRYEVPKLSTDAGA